MFFCGNLNFSLDFFHFQMNMAAARRHVDEGDLNFVFKRLGERGKEAELVKKRNDHVTGPTLERLTEFFMECTENQVIARPYGSVAEDLMCLSPDDYGNTDIMVFPSSEAFLIHEEVVDHSLESPLHVRIRAGDHPVLQSCLVEGTEYLATLALKNFHPAIYGSKACELMHHFTCCLRIFSKDDLKHSLQIVANWKNEKTSPAFTTDCMESSDTLHRQLQNMTESKRLHSLNSAEWEWFLGAICRARGVEYTREHAAVMDDFLQYMSELQESLTKRGPDDIYEGFPAYLHEMMSSDVVQNFKARVKAIESRSPNENVSQAEVIYSDVSSVTPRKAVEGGSKTETDDYGNNVMLSNNNHPQTLQIQDLESTSSHAMEYARCPNDLQPEKPTKGEDPTNLTRHMAKKDSEQVRDETQMKQETTIENEKDDQTGESEERFDFKPLLYHLFEKEAEVKEPSENDTAYLKKKTGIDLVPALKSRGWPKSARDWLERERKWPSVEMVTKIIDEGYHLVVKSPKYSEIPECDFRISFSHAEYLLSQEMNEIQRECYRCLKKLHRAYLSSPAGLVSFHLKNLFLQTIEETGAEMWIEDKRAECMIKLLENLLKALKDKDLRHFFVRSYNLFGVDYIVKPETLVSLAEKVEKIMENPLDFSQALIQQSEEKKKIQKETFEKESKQGVPSTSGHGRAAEPRGSNENLANMEIMKDAVLHNSRLSGNLLPKHRYHDLQDLYLQVGTELVEKSLNGDEIHDPLERSLVKDLKEMIQSHDFQTEHFLQMLRNGWSNAYFRICLSTELEMRRRMLDAIRGDVETWKYCLRQEDLASGNEEAIANRMLDPSNEDRFDLSNIVPAGGFVQYLRMFLNGVAHRPPQPAQVQASQDVDDIPLD